MKFSQSLYRAYDIRGLAGLDMSSRESEALGRELANFLSSEGPVCVGYDAQTDSEILAKSFRAGLTSQGRDVIDIGRISSDMIYFAVGNLGAAGGGMITASHNPGEYSGIKLCSEEAKGISLELGLSELDVATSLNLQNKTGKLGTIKRVDIMKDWIDHALSFVATTKIKPYHIAIDTGNGVSGLVIPYLESKWPVRIEPLNFEITGSFPDHKSSPLSDIKFSDLKNKIHKDRLDFGIAFDGDGDRATLIDEEGNIVSGSITTAILADYFLKRYSGATVLYNANCSRIVRETIAVDGGEGIRTRTGHSYIKDAMRAYNAVFAGEHSGHFYFRDNYYADSGLISAVCMIAALSESGLRLSELAAKYRKYASSGEQNFQVPDKLRKISELKQIYSSGEQNELDGLTVIYPDWWFIARVSNTEPYLRLNIEADNEDLLRNKLAELRDIMAR